MTGGKEFRQNLAGSLLNQIGLFGMPLIKCKILIQLLALFDDFWRFVLFRRGAQGIEIFLDELNLSQCGCVGIKGPVSDVLNVFADFFQRLFTNPGR